MRRGKRSRGKGGKDRNIEIHLTPELKAKVLGTYRESNALLANDLGIDLAQFGYC